jgi:uncharacterized protein involved in exopolysaccharide biosynthesis
MEQEIDLRPYLVAVVRHWRLIIIVGLALAIAGAVGGSLVVQGRQASADILVIPSTSQITLDPRFQTTTGSNVSNPTFARQALINLASSRLVAEQVVKDLGELNISPERLTQQVSVVSSSDLLQITVKDPDSSRALKIAEAWGKAYERMVADTYSRSPAQADLLAADITAAQQRYDSAQSALETFLKDGKIVRVQGQIASMTDMLSGSRQAQQMHYTDYLTRTRQIDLLLQDAQTLRDQAGTQATSGFADSFAALLLRARTVDSAVPSFQLSAGDITSAQVPSHDLIASLDQLITVLTRRREQLNTQAAEIAATIAGSDASPSGPGAANLQHYSDQLAALNSTYEQLQSQQSLLTKQRDLALDTLILLQRKHDEQEVARSSPQVEVRFISASIEPQTSQLSRTALTGVAAGIGGLVLGILIALFMDVIAPAMRRLTQADAAQPAASADAPADRPIPGD